jgi:hypothetical protein
MKTLITKIILFTTLVLAVGCEKDDLGIKHSEGYIIGFDPCEGSIKTSDRGVIIACNNLKDTFVTYNLPDTIFEFPQHLFSGYIYSCMFPGSEYLNYKIKFQYRFASENEKHYSLCTADIYTWEFSHYVRDRQIVVSEVTKINPKK